MRGYSSIQRQTIAIHRKGEENPLVMKRTVYKGITPLTRGHFVVYERLFRPVSYSRGVYHLFIAEKED